MFYSPHFSRRTNVFGAMFFSLLLTLFSETAQAAMPAALSPVVAPRKVEKVDLMAKTLLDWETLDADQINDIMEGREPRPPKAGVPTKRSSDNTPGGVTPNAPAPA